MTVEGYHPAPWPSRCACRRREPGRILEWPPLEISGLSWWVERPRAARTARRGFRSWCTHGAVQRALIPPLLNFASARVSLPHRSTPMRLEGFGPPTPRTERVHWYQPTCALGGFWKLILGNVRTFPRRAHIHIYMYGNPGMPEKHSKCMDLAFPSEVCGNAGMLSQMPRNPWVAPLPLPRSQARERGRDWLRQKPRRLCT